MSRIIDFLVYCQIVTQFSLHQISSKKRIIEYFSYVSMYKMATAGVPSGTILAVHLQKCWHLSPKNASSFSIIKQLMPALAMNIIIVHP
jgi:hypothetical protein